MRRDRPGRLPGGKRPEVLAWLSDDGKLLLATRVLRSFAYGLLSVILAIYLSRIGLGAPQIGIILTATLLGGSLLTILVSAVGDRIGRKRTLLLLALLMAIAGAIFPSAGSFPLLIIVALIGTINPTGGEVGPFQSLEQAILPQTCPSQKRTTAFALYSLLGAGASSLGALASGLPVVLQAWLGTDDLSSYRLMFFLYAAVGLMMGAIYVSLSGGVEVQPIVSHSPTSVNLRSKAIIARLAVLNGIDAFGGGFVIQTFVSYWFFTRFGVQLGSLAVIFFAIALLNAVSYLAAVKLAGRIGLINTMVFSHIPSNIILMLIPFAPHAGMAIALYLVRGLLSQMDVPTRQSYIMAVVSPEHRTAAAGLTTVSRTFAHSLSPFLAGYLVQALSLSAPFIIGGAIKVAYDLALFAMFRSIRPPEEQVPSIRT